MGKLKGIGVMTWWNTFRKCNLDKQDPNSVRNLFGSCFCLIYVLGLFGSCLSHVALSEDAVECPRMYSHRQSKSTNLVIMIWAQ